MEEAKEVSQINDIVKTSSIENEVTEDEKKKVLNNFIEELKRRKYSRIMSCISCGKSNVQLIKYHNDYICKNCLRILGNKR